PRRRDPRASATGRPRGAQPGHRWRRTRRRGRGATGVPRRAHADGLPRHRSRPAPATRAWEAMSDVHPPLAMVREAVARALAEDITPLGDITAALLPVEVPITAAFVPREP